MRFFGLFVFVFLLSTHSAYAGYIFGLDSNGFIAGYDLYTGEKIASYNPQGTYQGAGIAFGVDGTLYARRADELGTVVKFNAFSGDVIGEFATGYNSESPMVVDDNGHLYGIRSSFTSSSFVEFDPLTGTIVDHHLGYLNSYRDIVFGGDGFLYGYKTGIADYLSRHYVSTPQIEKFQDITSGRLAAGSNRDLLINNAGSISRFSLDTGELLNVFDSDITDRVEMVLGDDGDLFGLTLDNYVIRYNPITGEEVSRFSSDLKWRFGYLGYMDRVFSVPEPSSIPLFGLALAGLLFCRRRMSI